MNSAVLHVFHIMFLMGLSSERVSQIETLVCILIAYTSLYISLFSSPVSNGAMPARSQSTVGSRAVPVGVPSSTSQLLLILFGLLLDARGQGKIQRFSTVLLFVLMWDKEPVFGHCGCSWPQLHNWSQPLKCQECAYLLLLIILYWIYLGFGPWRLLCGLCGIVMDCFSLFSNILRRIKW